MNVLILADQKSNPGEFHSLLALNYSMIEITLIYLDEINQNALEILKSQNKNGVTVIYDTSDERINITLILPENAGVEKNITLSSDSLDKITHTVIHEIANLSA